MRKIFTALLFVLSLFVFSSPAQAATSPTILPSATGTYSQWTPNTGGTHYTTVDESPCNGTTDYVTTSTTGQRDSFVVSLSSLPDNSTITDIAIVPCASRASGGGGSATLNVFYIWNGTNSSDQGAYALSGTTPVALATSTWSSLSLTKTSTSTLEIGAIYSSGTKGARLSRVATQITYGVPSSATTSAASSITTTSALLNGTGNPNGTTTTAWFRIDTTSPGTCNDTFGTRVPLSGSTALGAGTSSVAYSTTTASLTQNTTYYYCAIASSGYGKGYGAVQSFTTSPLVTTISTNITSNQTWTTASGTYLVSGNIAVNAGVTLTINPGVVVKFLDTSSALTVSGTLSAPGSTSSPIYFTSYKDDTVGGDTNGDGSASGPYNGDWKNLSIASGGVATLTHAILRYGGGVNSNSILDVYAGTLTLTQSEVASSSSYGITNDNNGVVTVNYSDIYANGATTSTTYKGVRHLKGTTTIDHSTIRNNANYGLSVDTGSQGGNIYLTNNTFADSRGGAANIYLGANLNFVHYNNVSTGGGKGGIVLNGSPGSNQTWYGDPYLPYIINSATGSVTFTTSRTVTVGAGAIFKFEGTSAAINVTNGNLIADSSASSSKIYFTSVKDDTVGGDTNGDGSATSPAAGDWDTFKVGGGGVASSTLNNVVMRYGGYSGGGGSSKMLWVANQTVTVLNSEIASSSGSGIYNASGVLTATTTSLYANRYGYYHEGGTANIANNGNIIYGNSVYGIYNSSGSTINAERIYWPATTTGATMNGPYSTSTNPGGHGDAVLPTYIDFDPWVSTVSWSISTNTTWTASSTYVVDGTLTVDAGVTLTIPAATVVKFKTTASGIVVNGNLTADSAASSSRIYFTSYKDDAVGGDTNGDGSATSPAAGDWDGVKVNSGGVTTVNLISARYGGSGGPMFWNYAGKLELNNSEIASSSNTGIFHSSGATQLIVRACDIHSNNYGIFVDDSSLVAIGSNNIHGNVVGVADNTILGIDIRYNYWGDASGPYNSVYHPAGTGDTIIENAFTLVSPWLDKVHYLNFLNHTLVTSVTTGVIDWNWYSATSTYKDAWYGGMKTWNTHGNSVGGATIATSTTATSSADLLVLDIASSSADYFYAVYVPTVTPTQIKFNPYYMNTATTSIRQMTATHELGHAFGLWHSYINNIMIASPASTTGQVSLGTQDVLDYDYCWVGSNCGI